MISKTKMIFWIQLSDDRWNLFVLSLSLPVQLQFVSQLLLRRFLLSFLLPHGRIETSSSSSSSVKSVPVLPSQEHASVHTPNIHHHHHEQQQHPSPNSSNSSDQLLLTTTADTCVVVSSSTNTTSPTNVSLSAGANTSEASPPAFPLHEPKPPPPPPSTQPATTIQLTHPSSPTGVCVADFVIGKVIGVGGFSTVVRVRRHSTGRLYAMKVIEKGKVLCDRAKVRRMFTEREVMCSVTSPFVVRMYWACHTKHRLYLINELCPGGDLFYHIRAAKQFSESVAKYFFSQILLGLEALHQRGVLYRDLKSENLLLSLDGTVKLADFGLAKMDIYGDSARSFSFCGSPEYLSPEMLLGEGHGRSLDLYSLGCLLYEMLVGIPPYFSVNRNRMYLRVLQPNLLFPHRLGLGWEVRDLITQLVDPNPTHRIGVTRDLAVEKRGRNDGWNLWFGGQVEAMKEAHVHKRKEKEWREEVREGFDEIRNHPWLRDVDWKKMAKMEIRSPLRLDRGDGKYVEDAILRLNPPSACHPEDFVWTSSSSDPFLHFELQHPLLDPLEHLPLVA
eukprot:GHVS01030713.1.p1 GENE.GHVS01030713.1~~GHVS01030713.1.p1  ORF type:complete len:559 (-),score=115.69 GHVS01030713.1:207-1883(-)